MARASRWLPWLLAVAFGVAASAVILSANRGTTFLLDDWAYLVQRSGNLTEASLFGSQNGNWTTTVVLAYRGLADVFGIGSYVPWRIALLATHLGSCALVYILARRRVGPWWALLALALVLVNRGWETLLWPFQIGQALSILAGLGALFLLDRRDVRGDLGASALLLVALASSSYGPPFLLVAGVELLLSRRAALWVLVVPAAAWIWWQEKWNSDIPAQGTTDWAGFKTAVNIGWDALPGGPAAALGTSFAVGRALVLLAAALAVARMVLERRVHARLVGLIAAYLAYWGGVAWARSEIPNLGQSPRYVGLGVVLFATLPLFYVWLALTISAAAAGTLQRVHDRLRHPDGPLPGSHDSHHGNQVDGPRLPRAAGDGLQHRAALVVGQQPRSLVRLTSAILELGVFMYNTTGISALAGAGVLAFTGSSSVWAVVVAVVFILLGLVLLSFGRVRRRREAAAAGL